MTHLNGNLLCAIDVETTGFIAGHHDLIQVAVLPLDSEIKPLKSVLPFFMELQPKYGNIDKEAAAVNKLNVAELILRSLDAYKVADLFVEWVGKIGLPVGRKLVPLAHNWQFDKGFVQDWLGPETFNSIFHYHYRDSMIAALYLNDRADFHVEKIPLSKVSLAWCCSQLGVHNEKAHDALSDCVATAEVYRRLCLMPTL